MDFKDYRRGVGMLIINHEKKIFIGQRLDKDAQDCMANATRWRRYKMKTPKKPQHYAN